MSRVAIPQTHISHALVYVPQPKRQQQVERKPMNKPIEYREVIGLEVEVKGDCAPYHILFNPPAIMIPGEILECTTVKRPLQVMNYR